MIHSHEHGSISIQKMSRHNLSEVVAIEAQTFSPCSQTDISRHFEPNNRLAFVACDFFKPSKPQLVGWCSVLIVHPEAELLKIAVSSNRLREGIGQILLSHLIKYLGINNYETLFLEVRSLNQSALKLYKKNGFLEVGCRKEYYVNPVDDALIFKKIL